MRGLYLRVGLLAVIGAALVLGAVLVFSTGGIQHAKFYETYFRDSVQGLDVGAPVKYRGVVIGAVTQIGLTSAEYGRGQPEEVRRAMFRAVFVRFAIDAERVGKPPDPAAVAQGLRARIAPQGLTGTSYVDLDFVDPDRFPPLGFTWTPKYEYIPSVPSTLTQVQDAATTLLNKFQQVDVAALAGNVIGLTADLRKELEGGDVHALLAQATGTLKTLQDTLVAADVPALSAELRGTLASAKALAGGPQTKALLRSANQAVDRLSAAAARLPPLLASLQAVSQRADNGSADLEAALAPLLQDVRAVAAALRQTSEELRRAPGQVVLGGPPPRSLDR